MEWETASEVNSDYYQIERSTNALDWYVVGIVSAAGTSNSLLKYDWRDYSADPVINYYRLVQYGWAGHFEAFNTIAIDNRKEKPQVLRYYNLRGQEVTLGESNGLIIGVLEDGTSIKLYVH